MKRSIVFVTLCCVAVLGCSAPQHSAARHDTAIEAEVAHRVQRWSDAGEAQDWDAIASTYADQEGFAWIEQGETRYADHAAIIAGLNMARDMKATIQNDVSDIVVTPLAADVAAFRASYLLNVAAEGDRQLHRLVRRTPRGASF